ncbi:MAG: hypothetical protein WCG34_02010 [Leptolinea sp.]
MRTPAGFECSFFFGDYYRGKNHEECRLIGNVAPPNQWTRDLCKTCPVPGIQRANSCSDMNLTARAKRQFLGFYKNVEVKAFCKKSNQNVTDPFIGCGECHDLPDIFVGKPE